LIAALKEAGLDTLEKISQADIDGLRQIKGIGKVKAEKIIKQTQQLLKEKKA